MNIKKITKILADSGIEINEDKIEAKMLIQSVLGLSDVDLALNCEFEENEELTKRVNQRANSHVPVQQIIGTSYFMGEEFIVNNNVLIPRDETEILVRKCIEIINENAFSSVLDVGTGSGCIACTIAKNTNAQVLGVDISTDALSVALDNSAKLNLFNRAIFRKSDLFSKIREDENFDMIVSNPPYIPIAQKEKIQEEVKLEPSLALFATDKQGVEFYEQISQKAPRYLKDGGYLLFELGIYQAKIVKNLMKEKGFVEIKIIKDFAGIDRVILGRFYKTRKK